MLSDRDKPIVERTSSSSGDFHDNINIKDLSGQSYDDSESSSGGFSDSDSDTYPSERTGSRGSKRSRGKKGLPKELDKRKSRMSRVSRKSRNSKAQEGSGNK